MKLSIDASAIISVVGNEATSLLIEAPLDHDGVIATVTDFALAESSAALARNGRVRIWTRPEIDLFYRRLDDWARTVAEIVPITSEDVDLATTFVRRPDLALRAPDAIHIAAARRLGATLLTLDRGMARAAAAIGVPHINPAENLAT